jgi:cyclohexadienyl dehydratase
MRRIRKNRFDSARKPAGCSTASLSKAFVHQWLPIAVEDGSFKRIYAGWFE